MKSKTNREDLFTLDQHDLDRWRAYSLRPVFGRRSRAERAFEACLNEVPKKGQPRKHKKVEKKDWETAKALMEKFWGLQVEIEDTNSDAQMQMCYMEQQSDILDDLEVVYKKYVPVKKEQ